MSYVLNGYDISCAQITHMQRCIILCVTTSW